MVFAIVYPRTVLKVKFVFLWKICVEIYIPVSIFSDLCSQSKRRSRYDTVLFMAYLTNGSL